ncbi:MAG: molybdate ABC transporter permease subunit [Gammaproteobacteria bacterium]|nr:MAG: molybdate ABC transporter permease subunit [Gammaproteobacteria bacterium]RKZ95128.1 MAG: molybdate ABC transporter permease subunit [Gammaproteobacteria bacterium]RKZ97337.1 MAG: molybdate ABC transporter permease subunit [Gammaproteobacteria bacterium]RLA01850.1 MAG: molybdate ABC transporter permease subunit [Gammaproteobacteria bacterium]
MDWQAFEVSIKLALLTSMSLLPIGLAIAYFLAKSKFSGRGTIEAVITLPLVLPPTVLGYFLLVGMDNNSFFGSLFVTLTGHSLAFSFVGLWFASIIYSLPFAVQPMLRSLEQIAPEIREAAWCSGLSKWKTFFKIELPLAWPGIITAMVLSFAHTLGEFGVVLMIGGNIAGETRTVSIAIYDSVLAFDHQQAQAMSLTLLVVALITISVVYTFNHYRSNTRVL